MSLVILRGFFLIFGLKLIISGLSEATPVIFFNKYSVYYWLMLTGRLYRLFLNLELIL